MRLSARFFVLSLASAGLLACTPVVSQRGYLPDPAAEGSISVGKDNKTSVQARLGDPTTQASFGPEGWYYISTREQQVAFFNPTIRARTILAVYFDSDGKVAELKHFGLKDGNVVAFESAQTPARGRELTFLQQLFSATPGVPMGAGQEKNPGGGNGPPGQ